MLMGGKMLPVGGGGYLRLYPSQVTERYIERMNLRGLPAMVYLHPWEVDLGQERHYLGPLKTFQHYVNLSSTEWKLNRLLQRFDFGSISSTLELPRLQSLLRRQPVTMPETAIGLSAARPAYVRQESEQSAVSRIMESRVEPRILETRIPESRPYGLTHSAVIPPLAAASMESVTKNGQPAEMLEDLETTMADAG
jgi:hypothetical protein